MQADIGLGFLIAVFVSWLFSVDPTVWFILFCVVAALLPDGDFMVEFFKHGSVGGKVIREHRELFHFPISYIPVIVLVFLFAHPMWALALTLGILAHFIHDSIGIGWGIKWFWPFQHHSYKLFSKYDGRMSWKFIHYWQAHEMDQVARDHGIENWITEIYLRPHPINIAEWIVFLLGAVSLYLTLS